jgi:hypothetical protein
MYRACLSRSLLFIDQDPPKEDSMNSQLTPTVAQAQIAELQRAAERERTIRNARARISGSRRPRISLFALPFRPAQQA